MSTGFGVTTETEGPIEPAENEDEQDLSALLQQLNYCVAIAKRLAEAALAKTKTP